MRRPGILERTIRESIRHGLAGARPIQETPVITTNPADGPPVFCEVCFANFTKTERRGVFPSGHPDAFGAEPLAGKPVHPRCIPKAIDRIAVAKAATERRLAEDAEAQAATTAALDGIEGSLTGIEELIEGLKAKT